jgi:hypothetical protein
MSKRFGRNQKRRIREELLLEKQKSLRLNEAYLTQLVLAAHMKKKLQYLEEILSDVTDVLESNSSALPVETMEVENLKCGFVDIADRQKMIPYDANFYSIENMSFQTQRLHVLTSQIQDDPIHTGKHVIVTFDDMHWGYALSWQAIKSIPHEKLSRNIAEFLAQLISNDLKGKL